MKKNILCLLAICISLVLTTNSSYAYSPYIKNYKPKEYNAANQNWTIKQGDNLNIYIGNHNGLLEFDGYNWRMHTPGVKASVRSIYIDDNGRIYVGLNKGFGYFERNIYGDLEYTSLSDAYSEEVLLNRQIWSIEPIGENIYFQSFGAYFSLDSAGEVDLVNTGEQLYLIQNINNKLYMPTENTLYQFDGKKLINKGSLEKGYRIKAMTPYKEEEMLVFTESHGAWKYNGTDFVKWNNTIDEELKWATPNRSIMIQDSLILVGTILNGIYALNLDGTLAWHINNQNGLQNNTVLGIIADKENNIWVALDNGISVIHNTQFVEVKNWNNRDIGAVYDVAVRRGKLNMATNQGLFTIEESKSKSKAPIAELIPHTEGYITDLFQVTDDELIVGHSNGTFSIKNENDNLTRLSDIGGAMCHKIHTINDVEHIFQSSYTTINIYKKEGGKWTFRNRISDFNNPIQFFEIGDNNTIWGAHSIKGYYKIKVDKDFSKALTVEYFPSLDSIASTKIGVFKIKNRIIFTDETRCYTYDDLSDEIVPYKLLNDNIGMFKEASRIVKLDNNNYWFITSRNAALINFENSEPVIKNTIDYEDYEFETLDGFENIIPINNDYSILCYYNGLAKISHHAEPTSSLSDAQLSFAWAVGHDAQNDKIQLPTESINRLSLPYSHNNLRFGVSLPIYENKYRFSYFLKGLDEEKTITSDAFIEYTRLPYGAYTLEVEAINSKDKIVKSISYDFVISPPFYATNWAFLFYFLLVVSLIYIIYQISKKREINNNKKQMLQQEKEIFRLENEKLHNENTYKSKELASYAMSMIRQNEILSTLKAEIEKQKDKLGTQYPNKYYDKLMGIIDVNISSQQEWEIFQTNFDRIHESFFRNLRKRYPELTSSDLKICALLRLNLDNKEIGNLMNITIRAIETRRYRMRRKLNLGSTENLTEFLIDFK